MGLKYTIRAKMYDEYAWTRFKQTRWLFVAIAYFVAWSISLEAVDMIKRAP